MSHDDKLPHAHCMIATLFQFYRVCGDTRCKRAKRCAGGEPPYCFKELWPLVPEPAKILFRVSLTERDRGASVADAIAAAKAAVALHEQDNPQQDEPDTTNIARSDNVVHNRAKSSPNNVRIRRIP